MSKKSIKTLIEDIYSVLEKGVDLPEDKVDAIVDAFGENMKASLKGRIKEGEKPSRNLRLSGIGKEDRKLWYEMNGYPKSSLTGATLLKFFYGDIIEEVLLALTELSGHSVSNQQSKVTVEGVNGHMDAVIDDYIVDVKSAAPSTYKKFSNGSLLYDDPFGYLQQISAYKEGMQDDNIKGVAFLAMNKVDGSLCLYEPEEVALPNTKERIKHLKKVVKQEKPPKRCYTPDVEGTTLNHKLPIGCVFCDFKKECWKNTNNGKGLRAFQYAWGNLYLTHVRSVPRVKEIDVV